MAGRILGGGPAVHSGPAVHGGPAACIVTSLGIMGLLLGCVSVERSAVGATRFASPQEIAGLITGDRAGAGAADTHEFEIPIATIEARASSDRSAGELPYDIGELVALASAEVDGLVARTSRETSEGYGPALDLEVEVVERSYVSGIHETQAVAAHARLSRAGRALATAVYRRDSSDTILSYYALYELVVELLSELVKELVREVEGGIDERS